jgi:hypothetical protein
MDQNGHPIKLICEYEPVPDAEERLLQAFQILLQDGAPLTDQGKAPSEPRPGTQLPLF